MEKKDDSLIGQHGQVPNIGRASAQPLTRPSLTASGDFQAIAQHWFDLAEDERNGQLEGDGNSHWTGLTWGSSGHSPERLLGILAACAIDGCDVHFVSETDCILRHIAEDEPVPARFEWARQHLAACGPEIVAVLVFESANQLMCLDGTLRQGR
jgi:hypothetical protein